MKAIFVKLNPVTLAENPVIFVVEVGAALTTVFADSRLDRGRERTSAFKLQIALWLWFTVLFANFAEAMAEARGKAQAEALRKTKTDGIAKQILANGHSSKACAASKLRAGDVVMCEAGDTHPRRRRSD